MTIVVVIDDDASVRRATTRLLTSGGYRVLPFDCAETYLAEADNIDPDCLLLDVHMPGLDGMALQESLSALGAQPPIVFVTGYGDIPMTVRAMKRGAIDFLQKPVDEQDLLTAIATAVARGGELRRERQQLASLDVLLETLTPRESEVFKHIIQGKLNKQIASDLEISEKTVKVHRGRVMSKLEVRSVAELVRIADRAGVHVS
jgi:FixJ family two-component response regulator